MTDNDGGNGFGYDCGGGLDDGVGGGDAATGGNGGQRPHLSTALMTKAPKTVSSVPCDLWSNCRQRTTVVTSRKMIVYQFAPSTPAVVDRYYCDGGGGGDGGCFSDVDDGRGGGHGLEASAGAEHAS